GADISTLGSKIIANNTAVPPSPKATGNPKNKKIKSTKNINKVITAALKGFPPYKLRLKYIHCHPLIFFIVTSFEKKNVNENYIYNEMLSSLTFDKVLKYGAFL